MNKEFLYTIASDDSKRTRLVESLRVAASILTRTGRGPEYREEARAAVASELLATAAQLCDHERLNPDGSCRYCEKERP